MIGVFDRLYSQILEGSALLATNPAACAAIGLVQIFTILMVAGVAARLAVDLIATRQRIRRAGRWRDQRVLALYSRCVRVSKLSHEPALLVAPPGGAAVYGMGALRSAIFLSTELVEALDPKELQAVLLHELAHVARRDVLGVRLLQALSVVAITVVPAALTLAWVIARTHLHFGGLRARCLGVAILLGVMAVRRFLWRPAAMRREIACDERAIDAGADPLALAAAITRTWRLQRVWRGARWNPAATLSFVPVAPSVSRRVARLLDGSVGPRRGWDRVRRPLVWSLLASALLFVGSYHLRSAWSDKPPLRWSGVVPP